MTRSVSVSTGALIVVGMRWIDRLIGFVSTMILARLLVPEDFGIIAMAAIIIGMADVLLDMGVNITLIQNRNATREDYDAAWTLRLIQSALAALLALAAAEPAAEYFRDPRVLNVIQALALLLLLAGFENIGIVSFQKNMEFGREARYLLIKRLVGATLSIVMAWLLQSYWALVIGALGGRAIGVGLSYVMHPMRPHLSFIRMRPMLSFSTWNLLRGIAGFLSDKLHRFVVGGRESTAVMGAYSLGGDIAAMPSTELLAPLSRVLFPLFVKLKHDLVQLKKAFLLALGVQALVGIPAATGLVMVSSELVLALLGEKWGAAIPFIQILGVGNILVAIGASGGYMLLALGRAKVTASTAWLSVLLFAALVTLAIPEEGAMAIAMLRLAVASFVTLLFLYLVKRELRTLRVLEMLGSVWRPCLASAIMVVVLLALPSLHAMPMIAQLLIKISVGATVCVVCVLSLWRFAACPDGAEAYLLEKLRLDGAMRRLLRQTAR